MNSSEIVVGVDGSPASHAALRWAVRRAALDKATVIAVEVGPHPRLAPGTSYAVSPYGVVPPLERITHPARLRDAVQAALGSMRDAPTSGSCMWTVILESSWRSSPKTPWSRRTPRSEAVS
jgi:nucleotide-binding universal stress UspA family protein